MPRKADGVVYGDPVAVRLTQEQVESLRRRSYRTGVPQQELIRRFLDVGLKRYSEEAVPRGRKAE
jgi:hypothetical protein